MSDPIQHSARLIPDSNVIEQRMDGQLVLFHLQTNQLYQLNSTAARFWELIREGHDLAGIQAKLLEEFDVSAEQLNDEMQTMAETFQAQKLASIRG